MLDNRKWLAGFFEGDSILKVVGGLPLVSFNDRENQDMHRFVRRAFELGELGEGYLNVTGPELTKLLSVVADFLVSPNRVDKLNDYFNFGVVPRSFAYHLPSLDWLVGMWDANGSASVKVSYPVALSISSIDVGMLCLIRNSFGGSVYTRNGNASPVWHLLPTKYGISNFLTVARSLVKYSKNETRRSKLERSLAKLEVVRSG